MQLSFPKILTANRMLPIFIAAPMIVVLFVTAAIVLISLANQGLLTDDVALWIVLIFTPAMFLTLLPVWMTLRGISVVMEGSSEYKFWFVYDSVLVGNWYILAGNRWDELKARLEEDEAAVEARMGQAGFEKLRSYRVLKAYWFLLIALGADEGVEIKSRRSARKYLYAILDGADPRLIDRTQKYGIDNQLIESIL